MFPRLLATALLAGLGLPALCQQPQPKQITSVPDYILYDAFFYRVKWLDDLANKYSSQGRTAMTNQVRSIVRTKAGMTAQEDAALKAIAADWRARDAGIVTAGRALVKSGATAKDPRLQALALQRQQLVASHVSQLQASMGSARFQKLDAFVRASSTVKGAAAAQAPK